MDSRPPDAPRFWGRAPQRGQGGLWSLVQTALRTGPAPLGSVKLGSWSVLPGPALAAPQEVGCQPPGRQGGGRWRDVLGESPPAATAQHRVLAPRFCGDRARPRQAGRPAQRLSRWSCVCAGLWPEGSLRAAAARTGSG